VGGDGTLNYFINKHPHLEIPISIFSGGSGNDFAWKLHGDKNIEEQFDMAWKDDPKPVDVGICNGKYFINGVGIGFDGEIVRSIDREKFFFSGHLAYYAAVLRKIFFYRESEVTVVTKEIKWQQPAFMITVANGSRYGGGFLVAPDAVVDDGLYDIAVIPAIGLIQRLQLLPGASKGKHLRVAQTTRSDKVTIRCDKIVAAHCDGELILADEFNISMAASRFLFRY